METKKINKKKNMLKLAGNIFTAICIICIAYFIARMDVDWVTIVGEQSTWLVFLLLCALSFIQYVLSSSGWWIMTCLTGEKRLPFLPVFHVYARSNLAKYLPGNVMHLAGRNLLGNQLGITQADIALATVLDLIMTLFTAVLLSVFLSADYLLQTLRIIHENSGYFITFRIAVLGGMIGICVVVLIVIRSGKSRAYFRKLWKIETLKACGLSLINYSALFIIFGIINLLIYRSVLHVRIASEMIPTLIGLTIISWTAGFVVPGAPGGIGIREAVMLLLMAPAFGKENVAIAAVILRVINVIGDLSIYFVSSVWMKWEEAKKNRRKT